MLLALLQAESTLHRKIALHLPRDASLDSKTRVVARTLHDAQLTSQDVLDVLLPLIPEDKLTLVMDRTTWHYGQTPLNIMVLGAILGGAVVPLVWTVLPHQGNSSTAARILLVSRLLKVLPASRWAVLIADREFIGQEWCSFLRWKRIRQCLRIRENTRIDDELARDLFAGLHPGEVRTLFERTWVYGGWMQVVITLSPAGDRVIVASDLPVLDVLRTYRKRWRIESTFSALKSRGLNLESTHMTAADRISRLFGLLCIALAWMVRVGHDEQGTDLLTVDKRGRLAQSRARSGWTQLSQAVRWSLDAFWAHLELLKTPFSVAGTQKSRSVSC
ncbi:IS4-like element ISDds3 family transposase [Deinococcus deserti]|uniref:Putative transposase n=1 Tax=Deinococcus deserti (strain DSM 17065 / CIP 109153 / LMG 22923 / VCD115) TaxID=546414 RepID=C1D271_DEIDV|nr:IS4-like element ISDds3 family transposase [Deinococcus deserti]ACO47510.1 putative transposase [Deinococcus deserti VCD115]